MKILSTAHGRHNGDLISRVQGSAQEGVVRVEVLAVERDRAHRQKRSQPGVRPHQVFQQTAERGNARTARTSTDRFVKDYKYFLS